MKKNLNRRSLLTLTCLLVSISFCITSCKKDIHPTEKLDPVLHQKNLQYTSDVKISTIDLAQFKGKVDQSMLGTLKKTFDIHGAPQKLMSIDLPETYRGFAIETEHIKMIVGGGHTSYVFPVKLNSPHAVTFQNLTIDESKDGTFAFVTSYTPTQEWITSWKAGESTKFDGLIELTPINLENGVSALAPTTKALSLKGEKISSIVPLPKTALAQVCSTVNYVYTIPYKCASGQHSPGEPCGLEVVTALGMQRYPIQ